VIDVTLDLVESMNENTLTFNVMGKTDPPVMEKLSPSFNPHELGSIEEENGEDEGGETSKKQGSGSALFNASQTSPKNKGHARPGSLSERDVEIEKLRK